MNTITTTPNSATDSSIINGNEVTFSILSGRVLRVNEFQDTEVWMRTDDAKEVLVKINRLLTPIQPYQQISLLFAHNETRILKKPVSVFIHTSKTYYSFVNDKLCSDLKLYDARALLLPFITLVCLMGTIWTFYSDYISSIGWAVFSTVALVAYLLLFTLFVLTYHVVIKKRVMRKLLNMSKKKLKEIGIQRPKRIKISRQS